MLAALVNGVKGEKWFTLIDKDYQKQTLKAAWIKVKDNAGADRVNGQSVKQFEARAEQYMEELERALRVKEYRPQPIRRVEIPKVVSSASFLKLVIKCRSKMNFSPRRTRTPRSQDFIIFSFAIVAAVVVNLSPRWVRDRCLSSHLSLPARF